MNTCLRNSYISFALFNLNYVVYIYVYISCRVEGDGNVLAKKVKVCIYIYLASRNVPALSHTVGNIFVYIFCYVHRYCQIPNVLFMCTPLIFCRSMDAHLWVCSLSPSMLSILATKAIQLAGSSTYQGRSDTVDLCLLGRCKSYFVF